MGDRAHGRAQHGCRRKHRHCHARKHPLAKTPESAADHSAGPSPAGGSGSSVFGPPAPLIPQPGSQTGSTTPAEEAPAAGSSGPPPPARVQVIAKEFYFTLSRPEVPAGRVIVEFVNGGEDPHNLHLQPSNGEPEVGAFATSSPGTHTDQAFNMRPGQYTLFCSLPGHEALGMKATLTVK